MLIGRGCFLFIILQAFFIFAGCHASVTAENLGKVISVFKTKLIGNFSTQKIFFSNESITY